MISLQLDTWNILFGFTSHKHTKAHKKYKKRNDMSMWSQDQKYLANGWSKSFYFLPFFLVVQSTKHSWHSNTQMLKNVSNSWITPK